MTKIIMFSHVLVSEEKKFGPAIRTIEIAKALSRRGHSVTIAEKGRKKKERIDKIDYIPLEPAILGSIDKDHDVAFFQIWFNDKDFLEKIKIPIVFDLYAPFMIEHIYYDYDLNKEDAHWRFYDDIYTASLIPLRYGDYFICASDRQRKFYLGMLAACGRINPYNKEKDLIGIVPYGVKEGKPIGKEKILRKLIPEEKKIILWMSSFYSWLDPLKVIEIIYELNKIKDEYALAVVGAKSPFLHQSHYIKRYDEFMDSAKKKDLLGKSIYVLDWIEHDKIPSIYNESDMFIAAHFQSLETELSYRVRMTEALFGRLPIICDGGDVVSDMVKENKLGMVIEGSSPKETAKMIAEITEKDKLQFRKNIEKFIKTQTWDSLITPLDVFCKNPFKDDSKIRFLPDRLIDDRREIMLMQRKIIDEKEGIIRDLEKGIIESNSKFKNQTDMQDREIKKLNDLISDINSDNLVLTDKLSNSQHIIEEMTASNKAIASELIEVKNSLFDAKCKNIELGETITKQRMFIGKFRASIVFSLYKLTSTVGETRIGQILQKILK